MGDIRTTALGGTPYGESTGRPTNPQVGQTYYNGSNGLLEIYTATGWIALAGAPPAIPVSVVATNSPTNRAFNNGSASITFEGGVGGGIPGEYVVTSTPGNYYAVGQSSPITVTGLQSNTQYTFVVQARNNFGTSISSSPSSSITSTTVPSVPTSVIASDGKNGKMDITFTQPFDGGSSITNYKYSLDGVNYVAFSPAVTTNTAQITGLTNNNTYSIYLKAVNANGDSLPSNISNSVTITPASEVTGGLLASDSTYYYRIFRSSGTLSVTSSPLTSDIFLIGGGSGGGAGEGSNAFGGGGGGGGAGGVVYLTNSFIPTGTTTVTVGGGGNGVSSPNSSSPTNGGSGTLSSVGSFQAAYPGGPGAGEENTSTSSGLFGSSGGRGGDTNTAPNNNTVDQGFAGGAAGNRCGGGGGGAGGNGSVGSTSGGGAGGQGTLAQANILTAIASVMSTVSGWTSATSSGRIAGGGGGGSGNGISNGGGAGGAGGGGVGSNSNGSSSSNGSYSGGNGVENTGSGGGAQSSGNAAGGTSGAGGSGLVVFRYLKSAVI